LTYSDPNGLARIQGRLGHQFQNPALLIQALTHRSAGTPHNERLEFLGDGLLNCVAADLLFHKLKQFPEGDLSRLRAGLVNQQTLSEIAASLQLGDLLKLGEGELKSGGFRRPSILADALEALFGAVYLDAGFDKTKVVIAGLYDDYLERIDTKTPAKDPKTTLQEYLQGKRMELPKYSVLRIGGEAHDQIFHVECFVDKLGIKTEGVGPSRRAAEQAAAAKALEQIRHV
jgi:ribonuclease III